MGGGDRMLFRGQTLAGRTVVNVRGEALGRIEEFVIDPQDGRIEYAVLSYGELSWAAGEKLFAVPWKALRIDYARSDVVIDVDREVLEASKGFDPEAWPLSPDLITFPSREPADETGVDRSKPSPLRTYIQTISGTERTRL